VALLLQMFLAPPTILVLSTRSVTVLQQSVLMVNLPTWIHLATTSMPVQNLIFVMVQPPMVVQELPWIVLEQLTVCHRKLVSKAFAPEHPLSMKEVLVTILTLAALTPYAMPMASVLVEPPLVAPHSVSMRQILVPPKVFVLMRIPLVFS